jgi:Na+/proline symporter
VILVGILFAARLWNRGLTTFADLFRLRYSAFVERLVVIVLLPGSVFWAGAQVRAFGQVLASTNSISLTSAITLAAVLVAAYAVVGGLLADAVTDFLQGLVLIIGLLVLAGAVAAASGGAGAAIAHLPAGSLDLFAPKGEQSGLDKIEQVAVALGGSMVAVELISRFLGARSATVARNGTLAGGVMYLALGTLPVFLGLAARQAAASDPSLSAQLGSSEQLVAVMSVRYLPQWAFIIFAGAIVSAILSVVHAALHAPAAQISHNLVERTSSVRLSERGRLWAVRLTVMALSGVAYVLALSFDRIKELVELASAFGSAGVIVTTLFALFTRIGGPMSAAASILSGLVVWSAGRFVLEWPAPYMTALAVSAAAYLAVAALDRSARAQSPRRGI